MAMLAVHRSLKFLLAWTLRKLSGDKIKKTQAWEQALHLYP